MFFILVHPHPHPHTLKIVVGGPGQEGRGRRESGHMGDIFYGSPSSFFFLISYLFLFLQKNLKTTSFFKYFKRKKTSLG
jgi:hypothetical protein